MIYQIIYGTIGIGLGILIVWKSVYIVDHLTGRNNWAETTFGGAGTYTLIRLIGVVLIFISFVYATGLLNSMILTIWNFIFSGSKSS